MDWILFLFFILNKALGEELHSIWYCLVLVAEDSFIYLSAISLTKSMKASRTKEQDRVRVGNILKKVMKHENTFI